MPAPIILSTEGEQFASYSDQRFPFGTLLQLQDGRKYRFAEIGGTNIAAGRLCQSEVPGANFDELAIPGAVAVGARSFDVTNGATTIARDDFAGGTLNVEDDAGEGHVYLIEGNDAEAAGSADFEIRLAPGNGLVVAFTTATTVGLTKSPYKDIIIHPSPATAELVGVTPRALDANQFGWLQVAGRASVLTEGTVVINEVVVDSATSDGSVAALALTEGTPNTGAGQHAVGVVVEVAATTEHSLVKLRMEG